MIAFLEYKDRSLIEDSYNAGETRIRRLTTNAVKNRKESPKKVPANVSL